jgi:lipoprotein-anchoring transpeptidase ErfK/SrfK
MRNHPLRISLIAALVAITLSVAVAVAAPAATRLTTVNRAGQVEPAVRTNVADHEANAFGDAGVVGVKDAVHEETPDAGVHAPSAPRPAEPSGSLLVRVPSDLVVRAHPSQSARVVGTMPSGSKYYGVPITAWVEEVSPDRRWGHVEIPYVWPRRQGWIPLHGLARHTTDVEVRVDLSSHRITVTRSGRVLFGMPAATGATGSTTPTGEYFVTDRIPFSGGSLGTFAFGISGIQPHLPPGWNGGNQLAIHGTNDASSIGRSASAGCLRVSERSLDRLKPLLQLGTPVIVVR